MSYTPIPNPLNVDVKTPSGEANLGEMLSMILTELRISNYYLYLMPEYLNAGQNFPPNESPEDLRNSQSDQF